MPVAASTTRSPPPAGGPEGWLSLLDAGPSGDIDADLCVALLTLWGGGDRRLAADFLRLSADKKMESLAAKPYSGTEELAPLATWYTDLRYANAKALLKAEYSALRTTAESLPRNLTGKPRLSSRPPLGRKAS